MSMKILIPIIVGAPFGAVLRYALSVKFNDLFESFPMGTLFANLLASFLMGIMIGLSFNYPKIPRG